MHQDMGEEALNTMDQHGYFTELNYTRKTEMVSEIKFILDSGPRVTLRL